MTSTGTSGPAARRPYCYVASPLGFNEAGRVYYREHYLPALRTVVEPVDPWSAGDPDALATASGDALRDLQLETGFRNLELIRGCDLLVAWLDGQEVDSGTAIEIGFAAGLGVRCFGLRTDLRQAGEAGVAVNLQVEATIVASGGKVARSLDELIGLLGTAVD